MKKKYILLINKLFYIVSNIEKKLKIKNLNNNKY